MNPALLSGALAFALYTLASILIYRQMRGNGNAARSAVIGPGLPAVLAHGWFLSQILFTPSGVHLGLFPVASAVAAAGAAVVLISCLYRPFEWANAMVYPFAALTIPAALWIPTGYIAHPLGHGLGSHVLLSIVAYAVLALAACQAILLLVQHRQLKQGHIRGVMRVFPPVQVMESMLFEALWLGFALLTAAMLCGLLYVDDFLAQKLAHKTFLTLIAWIVFAVLLAGRHLRGWRGLTAIRFTLAGFALLLVAFFGTQFVLEVILKRA